jgi:glucose/arabinose dehydrogenase
LGIAFIPEEGFPEEMWNDVLVAYHGSWNRSIPTGYKVVRFDLASGGDRKSEGGSIDFFSGFLEEGEDEDAAKGRPVGILAEPGGIVYISDDKAGAVYRLTYTGE